MLFKALVATALASVATAQSMNFSTALGSNPNLSNLTTYIQLYPQLVDALSAAKNVTLLAPSNAAFAKLLNSTEGAALSANNTALVEAFFSYHILQGTFYASEITAEPKFIPTYLTSKTNLTTLAGGQVVEAVKMDNKTVFISGILQESVVTQADSNFTGGTVHVIDTFLTLPQNISATLYPLNETAALGALAKAEIAKGPLPSNVTAFIPNNAAWQAVANVVANLSMAQLQGVLAYHLVPDVVGYSTLLKNMTLKTLANETVAITVNNGTVFVNDAKVLIPNVISSEGVIHIIDAVLNPANTTGMPNPTATPVNFPGASSGSEVPFTSGIPAPTSAVGGGGATATSSSSSGLARPMQTGAIGAAALFGGAAAVLNF